MKTKKQNKKNKTKKINQTNKTNKIKGGSRTHKKHQQPHIQRDTKFQKRVNWKQLNCSPAVKGETVAETSCMVPAVLAKIKQEYNAKHRDHPIQQTDPVGIWQELHQRLKSCESEKCWLSIIDDSNERNKLKGKILRPDQPKEWKSNPDEWLSNYDIFNVAVQYEEEYPHFEMIGPSAIDFDTVLSSGDCVQKELCHFSLKDLIKKGKRDIGVVFNLDKHNEPGSHWVSLYVHVPAIANRDDFPFMFYFDSAGDDVPEEVTQLMNRIAKEGEEMDPTIVFKQYNNDGHDHQKGNTECGMYSLFFIITMLTGSTPFHPKTMTVQERIHLFTQKKIDDKVVFDYRDLYFNP